MITIPKLKEEYIIKNYWTTPMYILIQETNMKESRIRKVIKDFARDDAWNAENEFRRQMRQLTDEQRTELLPYLTHPKYRN